MRKTELSPDRELLPDNSRVLCAVSGGADSVALLALLREEGRGIRVACAHFHHGLRGAEADRDEAFVRDLCARWDLPFFVGRGDAAACARERGISVETAARELRYAFREETADAWGADLIATAHTAGDNAETLLLHLARGTGLTGLTGIPRRRGRIVRPLLDVSRAEIEAWLGERGIPHVEDSTNALDEAARNRLRHSAIPALESVNGAFLKSVGRTGTIWRRAPMRRRRVRRRRAAFRSPGCWPCRRPCAAGCCGAFSARIRSFAIWTR